MGLLRILPLLRWPLSTVRTLKHRVLPPPLLSASAPRSPHDTNDTCRVLAVR